VKSSASQIAQTKPVLLIIKHFGKLKAAEHEVVERIAASARELNWEPRIVEVDAEFDPNTIVDWENGVDAVLDIHYEYPKFFKPQSLGAVWTPTSFMKNWDLAYVWENQLSHDLLLHTDSEKILKLLSGFRPNEKFGVLNHSMPASWLAWVNQVERNDEPRAFYAGINWNKLSGRPGRHHELLQLLDKKNVLDIYGPRKISHIVPWEGFESYRGEIEFDGRSILRKNRMSGISLVLSSPQHLDEGVISSRLFEGLAAGNVIISDKHPFIQKHLGSSAFYLELEKGDSYVASQIEEYVRALREDPILLKKLQANSQDIFKKNFDMTKQLDSFLKRKNRTKIDKSISALVLGDLSIELLEDLKNVGFDQIEQSNTPILDLQDVLDLARSLDLSNFCVFQAKVELLDSFTHNLNLLMAKIKAEANKFGTLSTVALTQGERIFAPVIIGASKSIALNGLVVNLDGTSSNFEKAYSRVPVLRVRRADEIHFVSAFHDTYSFLANPRFKLNEQGQNLSLRQALKSEIEDKYHFVHRDLVEEIRTQPRSRRLALMYSLIAALPIPRVLLRFVKWILRKYS
jgi:hypothetical protein